jgi:hypothetical protein
LTIFGARRASTPPRRPAREHAGEPRHHHPSASRDGGGHPPPRPTSSPSSPTWAGGPSRTTRAGTSSWRRPRSREGPLGDPPRDGPDQIAMIVRAFGTRCGGAGRAASTASFPVRHNHLVDQFWSPIFNQRRTSTAGASRTGRASGSKCSRDPAPGRPHYVVGARISGNGSPTVA